MQVWGAYLFPGSRLPIYINITDGKNLHVCDYLPPWYRPRLKWIVKVWLKMPPASGLKYQPAFVNKNSLTYISKNART